MNDSLSQKGLEEPIAIVLEEEHHDFSIEALHRCIFGPTRFTKASHVIRESGKHDKDASFVALLSDKVVGSIRMTPIKCGSVKAYLLGPLVVDTNYRGRSIGTYLMEKALEKSQQNAKDGVFLMGYPAYYQRFGFKIISHKDFFLPIPNARERCLFLEYKLGALSQFRGVIYYDFP